MLFSSFTFIFIFLPIVWIIFHTLKCAHFRHHYTTAKIFLIISSLFFYAFWKVAYLPILLSSIVVNYVLAKAILQNSKIANGGGDLSLNKLDSAPRNKIAKSSGLFAESSLDSASEKLCHSEQSEESQKKNRDSSVALPPQNDNFISDSATHTNFAESTPFYYNPKFYFIVGIIFNLCLLGFFKYTDFLLENFNAFSKLAHLDFDIPLPHILLPLALSFVTFQQIAFLFDCYKCTKGELDENLHIDFVDYALFISFFPQLIAGPIVHHREMMPQFAKMGNSSLELHSADLANFGHCADFSLALRPKFAKNYESHTENPSVVFNNKDSAESSKKIKIKKHIKSFCYFWLSPKVESPLPLKPNLPSKADSQNLGAKSTTINYEFLAKGIFIFSIGLFKKVFIADSFAKWANAGFGAVEQGGVLNIVESWATSLSYTFQLYFDFSGYCDMAMGLALIFGIVLPLNFDSPYKSLNIAEFWRRWHITLGRFLRECLYIPLGGNRVSKILNLRNLFIVAFLSGVWHGAGWGFVIWGVLHGVAMVIHRIYSWILANSACGDFSRSASARFVNEPKSSISSLASHNHENSSTILEFASCKESTESSLDSANPFIKFTQTKFYKFLCWFITFNFINIAWIFFRAENLSGAANLIKGMFGSANVEIPHKWSKIFSTLQAQSNEIMIYLVCGMIVCVVFKNAFEMVKDFNTPYFRFCASLNIFSKRINIKCGAVFTRFMLTLVLFYASIYIMSLNVLSANSYTPFLYFNF